MTDMNYKWVASAIPLSLRKDNVPFGVHREIAALPREDQDAMLDRACQWWIGDWLNAGEQRWGEMYAQALDATDRDYGTLANYKWVASKIEFSRRREKVSFGVHQEIASMPEADRADAIMRAEAESWTVRDARQHVRLSKAAQIGRVYEGEDLLGYVLSLNLHRRHLNESQRAMVAAKLATMSQGARTDLSPIGGKSQQEAADLLNVGKRTVERAVLVRNEGTPEISLDAERKLGAILAEAPKNQGAKGSIVTGTERVPVKDETPTLAELGITKKTSARAQKLAALPDETFEKVR